MEKRKLIPLVLAMVAGTSIAYAAPQYDLGEVIVTATRLEEKTQYVPASVNVVTVASTGPSYRPRILKKSKLSAAPARRFTAVAPSAVSSTSSPRNRRKNSAVMRFFLTEAIKRNVSV